MEELLKETVTTADLEKFEKQYHKELQQQCVTYKTEFEYAWCLVRSGFSPDIKKGILLLEDLASRDSDGRRDYIYYLAIGNARLKQYTDALKYCKAFLQIEPNNHQVIALEEYVRNKIDSDTRKGVAVAGGAALVIGGLIGIGFALAKK